MGITLSITLGIMVSDTPHYENRQVGEANEVPFEVPKGWEWTTIGEITNYGNCENVDVNDIPSNGWVLELEDLEKDSAKVIQRLAKDERDIKGVRHSFHKGDVLYSKLRTYLNKVTVALEDGFCTTEIIPVTCMSFILPEYLNHVLRSKYFVDYTIQCGYGVKMPRLSTTDACNGLIPLPPYNEQKHIVASIESWFQIIDILEYDKLNLDEAIQKVKSKILDLAIHGKLVPQDPNDEPAIELLKRINPKFTPCDNAQCEKLPKGWCWTTLGNIGKWQSGATPSRLNKDYYNGNIPWLKTGDLTDGFIYDIPETITQKALEETSVKLNPKGSVLIAMYGATIGKIGILTIPSATNQACCACSEFKGIYNMYLFYYLLSHRYIFIMMGGGGAQPNISKEKITETLIPLPPLSEQKRIVAKIEELFAVIDKINISLKT